MFFIENVRIISIIELKKYVTNASIFGIIVNKLCYKKKLYLIILLKVNKNLEIGLYYIILSFNLAVHFWLKGNREVLLNVKKIT